MQLLTSARAVMAALAIVVTAAGQDEKKEIETRKALTILLFDADTKGISAGIKQIEIPQESVAKRIRLADAVAKPPPAGWKHLKRLLGDAEIDDSKREWVLKSVKMTLANDKVMECKVLSLRDTGKMTVKLQQAGEGLKAASSIDVKGLGKLTSNRIYQEKSSYSDTGDWTFYVYMAEYDEIVPKRKKALTNGPD